MTPEEEKETQILLIDPLELHPHEINVTIYGEEEVDLELVESIRAQGQLDPLVITDGNVIISGHRRWLALKTLAKPAKCLYMHFKTDLDKMEAIIECNRQREKNLAQLYNELKYLEIIIAKRAEERRLATLKQYADNKSTDVLNSVQREESGKTLDILAHKTGNKRDFCTKLMSLGKKADSGDEVAIREFLKASSKETTLNDAVNTVKLDEIAKSDAPEAETAKVLVDEVSSKNITSNKAMQRIKAEAKEHKEKTESQARKSAKIPQGKFSVIVSDTYPIADVSNKKIPNDEDSVLFLWSSASSLVNSLKMMEHWGFKYKSCIILDKGSSPDILMFGIHGTGIRPINKIPTLIHEKNRNCIYDLIEKMFPSQRYLELFKENTRKGWNIGHETEPEPQPPRNEHGAFIALPDHENMLVYKIRPRNIYQNGNDESIWLQCQIKVYDKIHNCSISLGDFEDDFVFVLPNVENIIIDFNEVFKTMTPIVSYRPIDNEYLKFTRSFPSEEWNEFVASRFPELIIDEPEESEESEEPSTQTDGIPSEQDNKHNKDSAPPSAI